MIGYVQKKMKFRRVVEFLCERTVIVIFFTLLRFDSFAQIKHYQHFGVEDGLLTNRLTSVIEGPDGFIWLTSNGAGITRFDGINFEHFNTLENVGTIYYFSSLNANGQLWFGGENYLTQYKNGKFEKHLLDGIGAITQIEYYQDSLLFCVGDHQLFFFEPFSGKIRKVDLGNVRFNQVAFSNGDLLAATDQGIWQNMDDAWKKIYPIEDNLRADCQKIVHHRNVTYFVDRYRGLLRIENGEIAKVLEQDALPSKAITFLQWGGLGDLYFGTEDRGIQVLQLLDSFWLEIGVDALRFPHVTDMTFDDWGNAWVTSDGGGLTKFYTESYSLYQYPVLSGQQIIKLSRYTDTVAINYRNGLRDFIIPGHGLVRSEKVSIPDISAELRIDSFTCMIRPDKIEFLLDSSEIKIHFPRLVDSENISAITGVDSNTVLIASDLALSLLEVDIDDSFPILRRIDLLKDGIITLIPQDSSYWFLSENTIGIIKGRKIVMQNKIEHPVFVMLTPENNLLLGTRDRLFFIDFFNDEINFSEVTTPYPITNLRSAAFDNLGDFWLSQQNSILHCRIHPSKPLEVIKLYNQESGIPRLEFLEDGLQSGPFLQIFAATTSGVLELVPKTNLQTAQGPILSLIAINAAGEVFDDADSLVREKLRFIRPDQADIRIEVKAIDQRQPKGIEFYHRLIPQDKDWIKSSSNSSFQFYGLPPGRYTFSAKAVNGSKQESNILEIPFVVLTPYYRQWWFAILVLLIFSVITYLIYRRRLRVQLKKNQRINDTLKRENKILQLEQAASRLQMNPHFIFNVLHSIQGSISDGDQEKARADLQIFSRLMRSYLEHSRVEKIILEDEISLLDLYLKVEQQLRANRFEYKINIDPSIDPSFIEIPTMLIQPFVENAIKHGMPGEGKSGEIVVNFSWFGKFLQCTIGDNGKGFINADKFSGHRSAGMDITRQRLDAYFKNKSLEPLKIESNERGTKVRVLLPTEI